MYRDIDPPQRAGGVMFEVVSECSDGGMQKFFRKILRVKKLIENL